MFREIASTPHAGVSCDRRDRAAPPASVLRERTMTSDDVIPYVKAFYERGLVTGDELMIEPSHCGPVTADVRNR